MDLLLLVFLMLQASKIAMIENVSKQIEKNLSEIISMMVTMMMQEISHFGLHRIDGKNRQEREPVPAEFRAGRVLD